MVTTRQENQRVRGSATLRFFLLSLATAAIHCGVGVLLYRGRILDQAPILHSDLLVFLLPFIVALFAYAAAFWFTGFLHRRVVVLLSVSFLMACISTFLFMFIAFNRYGT